MTEGLRGVSVFDCRTCSGKGRFHGKECPDCQGRRVVIVQAGHVVPRPAQEPTEPTRAQRRRLSRIADSQCTVCGSTSLESDTMCAKCLQENNERTAGVKRSKRTGEIG